MRRLLGLILTVTLGGCVGPAHVDPTTPPPPSARVVAQHTLDSTLKVEHSLGHGSGWVIATGVMVTAKHVTEGHTDELRVTTRWGTTCKVGKVLEHKTKDISLVAISGCEVEALKINVKPVHEGDRAYVAGHPFWSEWTFTTGTISDADENNMWQLDTVGEPGMSGGPVVDENGEVIGMAVAILGEPLAHTWGGETFAVKSIDIMKFLIDATMVGLM